MHARTHERAHAFNSHLLSGEKKGTIKKNAAPILSDARHPTYKKPPERFCFLLINSPRKKCKISKTKKCAAHSKSATTYYTRHHILPTPLLFLYIALPLRHNLYPPKDNGCITAVYLLHAPVHRNNAGRARLLPQAPDVQQ